MVEVGEQDLTTYQSVLLSVRPEVSLGSHLHHPGAFSIS
jgi:hypothetical protein